MKLVVDGVFFQLALTGIARVWSAILPKLAQRPDLEIILLDRGRAPRFDGIEVVKFPSYSMASNAAADSLLIERFCRDLGADVFTSTYYTTPVTLPSVLMVYDMIPEILNFSDTERIWLEKQIAVSFASHYVCISNRTLSDLVRFYPLTKTRSIVARCGLDSAVFKPRDEAEVEKFKREFRLVKPYYVLVGSRRDYKNGKLVFAAAKEIRNMEMEILCIGGEPEIDPQDLAQLPANVVARRIQLSDDQLSCAYAGAEALIFPSMYEGFGLPVIEAMSCGCPVITTSQGALAETSGEAALLVSGQSESELREAMERVQNREYRKHLVQAGLNHTVSYDNWSCLEDALVIQLKAAVEESKTARMKEFFESWKKLRSIQAEVDIYVPEHAPGLLA